MKKIIGILLCFTLVLQVMPAVVFGASALETCYTENFENVENISDVAVLSDDLTGMTLSTVDASEAGIGESGNSVLKLDMEAPKATIDGEIEFSLQDLCPEIAVDQELQFSIDFYKTEVKSATVQFFETYASNNRGKNAGLVQMVRDGDPVYAARMFDGANKRIYGDNAGADNDAKGVVADKKWHRLTINWVPSSKAPDNSLKQVTLTRLSDNKELFSVNDIAVTNVDYPMPDISKFKIGIVAYNGFPAQQIYFDNISIKCVKELKPMELVAPVNGSVIESGNTLTLEFNDEVDESTLGNIAITSETHDDAVIVSALKNTADGKKVDIVFAAPLAVGGKYTINTLGVKSAQGADCISEGAEISVKAPLSESTYYEDFENVTNLSDVATLSNTMTGMTLSTVDASSEGIGESGNKVLMLDMAAPSSTIDGTIDFALKDANPVIPVDKRYQFSVDFYKTDAKSSVQFFETYDPNKKGKNNGLVQMIRDGAPAYAARLKDGFGNLIYGSDIGATNDEKGIIPANQWYRLSINWTPLSKAPDNKLESVTLTRLSDDYEVMSVKNVAVTNADYPMNSITDLKIGILTYNGYPAQKIYFDNVVITELEPVEELKLISPANDAVLDATSDITLEFNKEVDEQSLDGISFVCENFADPVVASAVKNPLDGKKVDVALEYPLVAGGRYTILTNGVKDADGADCISDGANISVKKSAPEGAYISEDFSTLSNFRSNANNTTLDSSISNVNEDGTWMLKIAPSAANNTANGNMGDMIYTTGTIALDETGLIFETEYYPIGKGLEDRIFYLREAQAPWGRFGSGLLNVTVNSGGTPTFKICDGNSIVDANFYVGTAGHSYNIKYHLSKKAGYVYGKAYIYDNDTGVLKVSEERKMDTITFNVINEVGFAQKTWGAGETKYAGLYVYPATKPAYKGSDVAGEIIEDYSNLTFDVEFDSLLDKNTIGNIKVMAGSTEITSEKHLVADSKTVRVNVTGNLPELSAITVVCDGVQNLYGQATSNASFTFQTSSAHKVTGCSFNKNNVVPGETVTASVEFINNVSDTKYSAIIIAVYEKDVSGVYTMKNVSANTNAEVVSGNSSVPVMVTVPADTDVSKAIVKVMVLDNMTNMIPLCNDFTMGE